MIDHQGEEGNWTELAAGRNGESYYTGTGFPTVFYLARSQTVRYIRAIHDLERKTIHLRSEKADKRL